ncbi:MAG: hypothetical protein HYZ81_26710 [Nitrospinae bacterium]|nr:hypothetical protein [Nitrospinota bacterium]
MSHKPLWPLLVAAVLCSILPAGSQTPLPEGNGKQTVETFCVQCHDLSRVTRAGYNEQGWRNNLQMMLNVGAALPTEQIDVVTRYLAQHFPEKPKPDAVVMPGSVTVSIQEWEVPTPGSRPHDPLAAPDGSLWYTGQFANVLGRLDPRTGTIKEYRLKTPNSGPHGLAADKDGNIWYTGNFKAHIGKLNPHTGEVTEYPMPDPAARDPHTLCWPVAG